MSDIVKREFSELYPNDSNYLAWSIDAEIILSGKELLKTIKTIDKVVVASDAKKAQALHFLRYHLSTTLKNEYMTERDPKVLWDSLRECFENIESMILPKLKCDWQNLRYQDYKNVEDYNTALYGIVTRMKLCKLPVEDKDLIEKNYVYLSP
jgi:hypothetical protein